VRDADGTGSSRWHKDPSGPEGRLAAAEGRAWDIGAATGEVWREGGKPPMFDVWEWLEWGEKRWVMRLTMWTK
jgi:hypothetical protein